MQCHYRLPLGRAYTGFQILYSRVMKCYSDYRCLERVSMIGRLFSLKAGLVIFMNDEFIDSKRLMTLEIKA